MDSFSKGSDFADIVERGIRQAVNRCSSCCMDVEEERETLVQIATLEVLSELKCDLEDHLNKWPELAV